MMKGKFYMKNYSQLFDDRFEKSQQIDEQFSKIYNEKGLISGIEYLKSIGATKLDLDHYAIKYRIHKWTQNDMTEKQREDFLKQLIIRGGYVTNIEFINNNNYNIPEIIIETKDGVIKVMRFSAFEPRVKKLIPNIEDDSRLGNCYEYAYKISMAFPEDNNLTTGYIYGYSDKSKFLHSWVETVVDGEEYVIDATLNAIINKDGYYLMQKAKPITSIPDQTIREDLIEFPIIGNKTNIPCAVYYVFRDEIIKDLRKRKNEFER